MSGRPVGDAHEMLTAAVLGFQEIAPHTWQTTGQRDPLTLRVLRSIEDLAALEELQRDVFGVSDLDVIPASELVVIAETGGAVVAALQDRHLLGAAIGWGGYFNRRPRLVSDMLAVRQSARGQGIGTLLKKVQLLSALAGGFEEMVWTVDPLRAGNAHLNFNRLGAYAGHYEINRYGSTFGQGLYGGLPTDRLHITWPITSPTVHQRLLGQHPPPIDPHHLPRFAAEETNPADHPRVTVPLPRDVDHLLITDPAAVSRWRTHLRHDLTAAFALSYVITGFLPAPTGDPSYLLEHRP